MIDFIVPDRGDFTLECFVGKRKSVCEKVSAAGCEIIAGVRDSNKVTGEEKKSSLGTSTTLFISSLCC